MAQSSTPRLQYTFAFQIWSRSAKKEVGAAPKLQNMVQFAQSGIYSSAGRHGGSAAKWLACWTQAQKAWVQIAVATLSEKLLTPIVPRFTKQRNWVAVLLKGCGGNCGPGGK